MRKCGSGNGHAEIDEVTLQRSIWLIQQPSLDCQREWQLGIRGCVADFQKFGLDDDAVPGRRPSRIIKQRSVWVATRNHDQCPDLITQRIKTSRFINGRELSIGA